MLYPDLPAPPLSAAGRGFKQRADRPIRCQPPSPEPSMKPSARRGHRRPGPAVLAGAAWPRRPPALLAERQAGRVDNRQARQSDRITHGVEQGQITPREQLAAGAPAAPHQPPGAPHQRGRSCQRPRNRAVERAQDHASA